MNRLVPKSIFTRLALLIGALTLTATITAVAVIISTASFQQQLVDVDLYAASLRQGAEAQANVLKTQVALKSILLAAAQGGATGSGDFRLYSHAFSDYLSIRRLQASDDPDMQSLLQAYANFEEQSSVLFAPPADDGPPAHSSPPAHPARPGDNNAPPAASPVNDSAGRGISPDSQSLAVSSLDGIDPLLLEMEARIASLNGRDQAALLEQIGSMRASGQVNLLIGQGSLLVLMILVIWGVYEMYNITRPLDSLTCAIVAFENNTYSSQLLRSAIQRADEFGQLAYAVDGMARSITESNRLKDEFMRAAQRFVPSQYLEFLEKDDITRVKLGDHVKAEMAVMFSDIRGFTSLSEKMTAQENFDFVNEYLKLVSPIIQQHEGFVVKFLGDGMMAIFPYGVDDAVQAGVDKAKSVLAFNQTLQARGLPPIAVGIGVHTGPMMVGMIGEEFRMQGDAFSDNVNLTSRIEGLNKFYGTAMIISEETLQQIPHPARFKLRSLGKVVVKGRIAPLGLYEVYDGLPADEISLKDATRADFESGLQLYAQGKFAEAGKRFSLVMEKNPSDKTAKLYLEYCAEWLGRPLPENWNGAIVMDAK